jgi:hypothetical protein
MWSVANVVVNGCPEYPADEELMDPPVGPSVEELTAALGNIPGVSARQPVAATVDGFGGVRMNLTLPAEPGCEAFKLWVSPPVGGVGEVWGYSSPPGWLHQIWIVDVDGLRFLIDAASAPGAPEELRRELDQMVSSIGIVP